MSATSDDVVAYTVRHPRLSRLLERLGKRQRNQPAVGERKVDPPESRAFSDSEMYADHFIESEITFMSMMWMGM